MELPSVRVCAGCADPKDHSQHNMINISPAELLKVAVTGGRPEPKIVTL